jgi:hypothetical protein
MSDDDLNKKINKLLKTSFFLNPLKKKMILNAMQRVSSEQKESLLKILLEEKNLLKDSLKKYLLKNGKEGIATINRILKKGETQKTKIEENKEKIVEEEQMDSLLQELESL